MQDVYGKTAFITGGASGIGLGMAQAFVDAGMKLVIADIRADHLQAAETYFAERQVRTVHLLQLDVSDRQAFGAAADEAERIFGPVHVLCNNAGMGVGGPIADTGFDDWDWGLDVLLGGVVNGLTIFLPRILRHGEGGHIVNTSSTAALVPGGGVYATAKGAVLTLTESIEQELAGRHIGVTVLCPGLVQSNIHQSGRTRPEKYRRASRFLELEQQKEQRPVSPRWMDARTCGDMVLDAIRTSRLYVITHSEYKAETEARFRRILDAFPDTPPDETLLESFRKGFPPPPSAKPEAG